MKPTKFPWHLLIYPLLLGVVLGFFYFETSLFLRIMVIFLSISGFFFLKSMPEVLLLLIFYLGLYDLYNVRYSLAVPLALIIAVVFTLTILIFHLESRFKHLTENMDKNLFQLFLATAGLLILEIFLTMTFWPVDPKIKSLVILFVFYLIFKTFYLYINSVLNLKKMATMILVTMMILGGVLVFNMFFGF